MNRLISTLKAYVHDALGVSVDATVWKEEGKFPLFLRGKYQFYITDIMAKPYLLMIANDEEEFTPATVLKQWRAVTGYWPQGEVIYITRVCSAYNRKRLIAYKIPFIVPGNQMYMPMIGLDLRQNFKRLHEQKAKQLKPIAQLLVLAVVKDENLNAKSPSEFAKLLGCSAMSMTRSVRELESLGLARVNKDGRKQQVVFHVLGKELWLSACKKMASPVRKCIWVKAISGQSIFAGESALAKYTMMAEAKYPVFAITSNDWSTMSSNMNMKELTHPEPGCVQLELWRYRPEQLAEQGYVDRFSLWLSLQDSKDERIEMALEEMMEAYPW
ncbi:MAG: hypothetical protein Q9N02_11920 [Ghiorsea sp.]|nr:hypothetical protein [Ghiorsea sp.]